MVRPPRRWSWSLTLRGRSSDARSFHIVRRVRPEVCGFSAVRGFSLEVGVGVGVEEKGGKEVVTPGCQ